MRRPTGIRYSVASFLLPAMLIAGARMARGQEREPHIGYVYPAAGNRGLPFRSPSAANSSPGPLKSMFPAAA